MSTGSEVSKRQLKHIAIGEAIDRLGMARNGLQSLLEEITGQDNPPQEKGEVVSGNPSMLSFLNGTDSEISKTTDDLNRIRDEIHVDSGPFYLASSDLLGILL